MFRKLFGKSSRYKASRSDAEWKEYHDSDSETKAELDKRYQRREDSNCQVDGCNNSAVHHEREGNKSGRCLGHWEGDSDDNG